MKVKFLVSMNGPGIDYLPKQEVDVEDEFAERLIARGMAVACAAPKKRGRPAKKKIAEVETESED